MAGIEAAHGGLPSDGPSGPARPGATGRIITRARDRFGAWGRVVREPAAYMVRGGLGMRPGRLADTLGLDAGRVILMFDMTELLADPGRALDVLLAGKRAGARVLVDNFDMEDPPARFMEMLPADILRVAPGRMPWHWDEDRRRETMEELSAFARNLLMDVAVENVGDGQRRALRRMGVRYVQGAWRRDALGLVPDPVRL